MASEHANKEHCCLMLLKHGKQEQEIFGDKGKQH